jgi:hypothetical protein
VFFCLSFESLNICARRNTKTKSLQHAKVQIFKLNAWEYIIMEKSGTATEIACLAVEYELKVSKNACKSRV